jgi:NADH-quinone oxidoreductase subunit C
VSGTAATAGATAPDLAALAQALGGRTREARDGVTTVSLPREALSEAFAQVHAAGFRQNTLVTAVDHHPRSPRFEVVWMFLRHAPYARLRLACLLAGDASSVPTCTRLWPGADFSERECWDMFGVGFEGHPDLRRLLMPEGYEHHPLRKDFPHQGLEPDRLYREWDRERRARWEAEKQGGGA